MKYLVVSIHDAAPPFLEELNRISGWLDTNFIRPRCIKVIPDYQGRWNICDHRDFLDWLKEEKRKGSEMIQHGNLHFGKENTGSFRHRLRNRYITHQNAEFMRAGYEETWKAVENGMRILKEGNVSCQGFTSPTWYMSKEAEKVLQDFGFMYYTSCSWIRDCRKGKRVLSSAMGDLGVGFPLGHINMLRDTAMRTTGFRCSPLARIVLHPQTNPEQRPFRHALDSILKLARNRKITTYEQFLETNPDE